MHHAELKKRWRYQITTRMKKAHREGQWRFPKTKDSLKHFPMIRSAGLFSNRWKQRYLSQVRIALNQTDNDDTHSYTLPSWAEGQSEYTGIDF